MSRRLDVARETVVRLDTIIDDLLTVFPNVYDKYGTPSEVDGVVVLDTEKLHLDADELRHHLARLEAEAA